MLLEDIQKQMYQAMRDRDKIRKNAYANYISIIKKNALDKGYRDNIPEELVNETLTKIKKMTEEQLRTCPTSRTDLLAQYGQELVLITEIAPKIINDPEVITHMINETRKDNEPLAKQRGAIMKALKSNYIDMGVANQILTAMIKEDK